MLFAVLLLAVIARLAAVAWQPESLARDPDSYRLYAQSLIDHGTFLRNDVPSAWRAPLYPLTLALCLKLPLNTVWSIAAVHILLGVATVWLTMALARLWGLGNLPAVAGLLVALDPLLVHQSTLVMSETIATFFTALALWAATRWLPQPTFAGGVLVGMALGACALVRPSLLLWSALLLAWLAWRYRSELRLTVAPLLLGLLVALTPWALRNAIQLGRPVLTTTHGGFTLLLANNPHFFQFLPTRSRSTVWDSRQFVQNWQATLAERQIDSEIDENRLAYQLAWSHISESPGQFVRAMLYRLTSFWRLVPLADVAQPGLSQQLARLSITFWNFAVFALALLGVLAVEQSKAGQGGALPAGPTRPAVTVALLLVLSLVLVHLLFWTDMRMRAPIVPVLALLAALGWRWLAARRRPEPLQRQAVTGRAAPGNVP